MENGEVFRHIRQNRHFTLAQVADHQISAAAISKFERGLTSITFDHLEHLLQRVNVSVEEFLFYRTVLQKGDPDFAPHQYHYNSRQDFQFVQRINQLSASTKKDNVSQTEIDELNPIIDSLLKSSTVNESKRDHFEAIAIKFYQNLLQTNLNYALHQMDEHEGAKLLKSTMQELGTLVRPVTSYLFKVESWGYFELFFFQRLHAAIPNDTKMRLLPLVVKRTADFDSFASLRSLRMDLLFGLFSDFINARQFDIARETLTYVERLLVGGDDLKNANMLLFCNGWFDIFHGEVQEGRQKCERAIEIEQQLRQSTTVASLSTVYRAVQRTSKGTGKGAFFL